MLDLLAIGDSTIDDYNLLDDEEIQLVCQLKNNDCQLCLSYADKIPVKEFRALVGGNAPNAAVGASRLGLKTAIISAIGDDDAGAMIRATLTEEDVRTDYLHIDRDHPTNHSTILSYRGERTILIYHAPRRYHLPKLTRSGWIYLTSLAKGGETLYDDIATIIKRDNTKLVFQPGTHQLRLGLAASKELLSVTEVIIMNKEEACLFLDMKTDQIPELIDGLLAIGPKIAVVTDAKNGAWAGTGRAHWSIKTRPEIPRKEATGAGDAFSIGLTAALIHGEDIPTALRWGSLNAESVIQHIGPQAGLLHREQMANQLHLAADFHATPVR